MARGLASGMIWGALTSVVGAAAVSLAVGLPPAPARMTADPAAPRTALPTPAAPLPAATAPRPVTGLPAPSVLPSAAASGTATAPDVAPAASALPLAATESAPRPEVAGPGAAPAADPAPDPASAAPEARPASDPAVVMAETSAPAAPAPAGDPAPAAVPDPAPETAPETTPETALATAPATTSGPAAGPADDAAVGTDPAQSPTPAPAPEAMEASGPAIAPVGDATAVAPSPEADPAVADPAMADPAPAATIDLTPAAEAEAPDAPQVAAVQPPAAASIRPSGIAGIGTPARPLTERDAPEASPAAPRAIDSHAAPFDNPDAKPRMAIVLIDRGDSPVGLDALRAFPYPLSFAVDPLRPDARAAMDRYRAAGFEVLALADLPAAATPPDVEQALGAILSTLPDTVAVMEGDTTGVQASKAASDQVTAMLAASGHGAVFLPNGLDTARKLAERAGVPAATVFRDFDGAGQDAGTIRRFLDQAAFRAGQEAGGVIMLGRLRPETISALLLWGLQDRAERVALAPVSAVLRGE